MIKRSRNFSSVFIHACFLFEVTSKVIIDLSRYSIHERLIFVRVLRTKVNCQKPVNNRLFSIRDFLESQAASKKNSFHSQKNHRGIKNR